jgi:thiol:disulfide interchange protein
MAKLTIVFGVLLILVGAGAFFVEDHHPHTLIPAAFGLLLVVFGALANTPDSKRRALYMHIAVTVGLLGFLGTLPGIVATIRRALGQIVASPVPGAAIVQTIMGGICLVFVLLCVRSFIAARRARTA